MKTLAIGQPRLIDPSLVEKGDDISVEYVRDKGIITTLRGIVGKRVDSGKSRYLLTTEGATLLSWSPDRKSRIKVTLFGRAELAHPTMFDLPEELAERMAG